MESTAISVDHQLISPSPPIRPLILSMNSPPESILIAEHLRDLADQDVEREAADESDEDRLGEEVRQEAQLEHGGRQEHHSAEDRLRQRQREVVGAAGHGEPADRGGDQGGGRGIR